MKRISLILAFSALLLGAKAQADKHCDPAKEKGAKANSSGASIGSFGAKFKKDDATAVAALPKLMEGKKESSYKIKGVVTDVCKARGCWMEANLGNGKTMRITFKDYSFFVPKDCSGKTFYATGKASWETTSIEEQKHYASDAGKSKAEINAINQPLKELVFVADGVELE